jgi:N-acetylneuraminic acid mutarotase
MTDGSFGGTDGLQWFNDTWFFDARTNSWVEVECTGHTPSPREGHAAALIGDVMYIFGGRGSDGKMLSDLYAFKMSCLSPFCGSNSSPPMVFVPEYGPWT